MKDTIRDVATLKKQFIALLDKQASEQEYQEFIEQNTALVPREFVQNPLYDNKKIVFNAGEQTFSVAMKSNDYKRLVEPRVASIV